MYHGFDLSHWNMPADYALMYRRMKEMFPDEEPFLVFKVSEGVAHYDDGIMGALHARDAGWKYLAPYHFYSTRETPERQAARFLAQWDKFPWTMRPALDCEGVGYNPAPTLPSYPVNVLKWYGIVDAVTGAPSIHYSNRDYCTRFFTNPEFSRHPLWFAQTPTNPKVHLSGPTVPLPWIKETIWQKSFKNGLGKWMGASSSDIDIDEAYWIPV